MKYKSFITKSITVCIDAIRPMLGPRGACIYPITCRHYAKAILTKKPLWKAIPLISLRVLSCNPLTALCLRIKKRF